MSTLKMNNFKMSYFNRMLLGGLILLSACNGNNDSVLPPPTNDSIVTNDETFNINQAVDLTLFFPNSKITQIDWQQITGPTVSLLANKSKTIAFTPRSAGEYSFTVSFTSDGNSSQSLKHTIIVSDETNIISARLGHAVLEGNKVSLRADASAEIDTSSLTWQQVLGPTVTFTEKTAGALAVFFDAPNVTKDTLLAFKLSGEFNGETVSDHVSVLIESAEPINENAYFDSRVATTSPFNVNSPYADNLVACVYSNQLSSSCTFAKLPLIAQDSFTPTIEDIMDRVVVSHAWMGERFKAFLQNDDPNNDFKNLLRATTAIVISYDVRPSFYWAATGAIYLDANNFWLTPDERDTINEAPDYRAGFGKELQFVMPWRYVKNNQYASTYFPSNERVNRTSTDGLYRLVSLMYHELSHANDFLPQTNWLSYDSNQRVLDAALSTETPSENLAVAYPLTGDEMRALANVSFAGETATNTQKNYTPADIEGFFKPEHAIDFYNYSSVREDYAMLFEALMMQSRYGVIRDVAVTNLPKGDNISSKDYIVQWGQRGRVANESIKPRVAFTASRILPEFDNTSAINNLPMPIEMISGESWLENLTISPASRANKSANKQINNNKANQRPQALPYYHKALPAH